MRTFTRVLSGAAAVVVLVSSAASAQAQGGVAIVDITVLPMDRERVLFHRTVLIRDDRILSIGAKDSVPVPAGFRRLEFDADVTLMPGLVDAHTHLRYDGDLTLYLAGGVTTVRNMNGGPEHLAWRRAVDQGAFGPRILTAAPVFHGPHPRSRAAATGIVDSLSRMGYDFLKVYDDLPGQSYQWLVEAARANGMRIAGHIPSEVGLAGVLKAQQQSIEHAEQIIYHAMGDAWDWSRLAGIADTIAAAHTAVTPTLEIIHALIASVDEREALFDRPEFRYVHPETQAFWLSDHRNSSAQNRVLADLQDALVRELARRGVLGLGSGTIAAGQRADLLFVRGNPLIDLQALERIEGVMSAGRWHSDGELGARLAALMREYAPGRALVAAAISGRAEEGMATYRRSVDSAAADAGLIGYLARIARDEGRTENAIALYKAALSYRPSSGAFYEGMARTYMARGDIAATRAAVQDAIRVEPGRRSAMDLLRQLQP